MKQHYDRRIFNNLSLRKKVRLRRLEKCIDVNQLKAMAVRGRISPLDAADFAAPISNAGYLG